MERKKGWILFVLLVNSWFGFARTHWVTRSFSLKTWNEGVNKDVERLFWSFYYIKQIQVIHQKLLRHKKYERQRQRVATTLGKTLIFYGCFYFNLKKRSNFSSTSAPSPGWRWYYCTEPLHRPSLRTTANLKKIELSYTSLEHAQMLDTGSEHCCRVTFSTREQTRKKNLCVSLGWFKIGKTPNIYI